MEETIPSNPSQPYSSPSPTQSKEEQIEARPSSGTRKKNDLNFCSVI